MHSQVNERNSALSGSERQQVDAMAQDVKAAVVPHIGQKLDTSRLINIADDVRRMLATRYDPRIKVAVRRAAWKDLYPKDWRRQYVLYWFTKMLRCPWAGASPYERVLVNVEEHKITDLATIQLTITT